jgi:hypothetical protein
MQCHRAAYGARSVLVVPLPFAAGITAALVRVGGVPRDVGACNLNKDWSDERGQHEGHKESFHVASPVPGVDFLSVD